MKRLGSILAAAALCTIACGGGGGDDDGDGARPDAMPPPPGCGNGVLDGLESCDDGDTVPTDGCSSTCTIEAGWLCAGTPSTCEPACGDGLLRGGEPCDDANLEPGDGCSATCGQEAGWVCTVGVEPSQCVPDCGDSALAGDETCDDGNDSPLDGCSGSCQSEHGYSCAGLPSVCTASCGDGLIAAPAEACDSGAAGGNGCGGDCQPDPGYQCAGEPSVCTSTCGDGIVAAPIEACDDVPPAEDGDGCSAACAFEPGFVCAGSMPTQCLPVCGDGLLRGGEACDDAPPAEDGDGCSALCTIEPGSVCFGEPSACEPGDPEPNDTCTTPAGPLLPELVRAGSISPLGDVDVWAITLPARADLRIETFVGAVGACPVPFDTTLEWLDAACSPFPLAFDDDDGIERCALLAPSEGDAALAGLAPGTYHLRVGAFTGSSEVPLYRLQVSYEALCGDGVREGSEDCDGGAGCGADCRIGFNCGDGLVRGGEQCDDGGTDAGDGCDDQCLFEPGFTCTTGDPSRCARLEQEPNDSCLSAEPAVFAAGGAYQGAIVPAGDQDFYVIEVPGLADLRIETFDTAEQFCNFDSVLELYPADCSAALATDDDGGQATCSLLDQITAPVVKGLAPGSYVVAVRALDPTDEIPGYRVRISYDALCGDGRVDGDEHCDDGNPTGGDGCSAACLFEGCGDGVVDTGAGEQCDDGFRDPGDGCDAGCQLEPGFVAEIEPNDDGSVGVGFDDFSAAAAQGPLPVPVTVVAALQPAGDDDVFVFTNATAAPVTLRADTWDPALGIGVECGTSFDTTLDIRDAAGVFLAGNDDRAAATDRCSGLAHVVPAGATVYLHVRDFSDNDAIAAYLLELRLL